MASLALRGLFRSLRLYREGTERHAAMDRLYANYIAPNSIAFDVGSHVGDRIASFRRLGARVVALEPQPLCFRALRLLHGRDQGVTLLQAAVGDAETTLQLRINRANPTVTTASPDFVAAAFGAEGWAEQVWDDAVTVPCTTLDALIASHGRPDFIKIDVEGFEPAVLNGLTLPVAALSFEFTTIQREAAFACLDRLAALGPYSFNYALGESQSLVLAHPVDTAEMRRIILDLPHRANSGDVYATLAN